jgi:hypothetical protein
MRNTAAMGCGCLLGAGASQLSAAEWSLTPLYGWSVDHDSNPRFSTDPRGSESTVLSADLRLEHALEDSDLSLEPRYTWRRYSDSTLGNGDERSLAAAYDRTLERSRFDLRASIWDQSTLVTEILETGIERGDTHRELAQAGSDWSWNLTEDRLLVAQLSYLDVSYYGQGRSQLPGYKYSSGSLGERFVFSARSALTISAFGTELSSQTRGNSSRELGIQAQLTYDLSERTHFDGSLGESSRFLAGVHSQGTDAAISLTHDMTRGNVGINYTRSLVPYGIGFLVQRQQYSLSAGRQLTEYLDASFSLTRVDNNEIAVLLGLDRRSYESAAVGLNWHPRQTWTVGGQVSGAHTQSIGLVTQPVNEWHTTVTVTWTPLPLTRSW